MTESNKITIADIARKAQVSAMTVSRVLSGKGAVAKHTERRVRQVIKELDYYPNLLARSLSSSRSMNIGVTIPIIEQVLMDNYITQVLSGITDAAQQMEYRITLIPFEPYGKDRDEFVKWAHSKILDGLILIKTIMNDPRIDALAASGFPFILLNHKLRKESVSFVDSRNVTGARMAVDYLYGKGHRQIAFVAGNLEESNARDRLRGFKESMLGHGLEILDNWIIPGWFDQQAAYIESQQLFISRPFPTAVICADDYMAIGVIRRIHEAGMRIPGDVAVIGFDDIELAAYLNPPLTTIRQPLLQMGKEAAEILLDLIEGKKKAPVHKFLEVELIERETC